MDSNPTTPPLDQPDATHGSAGASGEPPLCVDLDGTLIATDSLWEALLILAKSHVWKLLQAPGWISAGKAQFKAEVAKHATVDVTILPYRADIIEFLEAEKRAGRKLVLATASHRSVADAVAGHLKLFDEVVATEGPINLAGSRKLEALERRFGKGNFDYIGDSPADLCLWSAARRAYLVAPSRKLAEQAAAVCKPHHVFMPARKKWSMLKALRPHQWLKNLLLLVPLILAHQTGNITKLSQAVAAFWAFSLCASSVYILNDLLDLESDRRHPTKRNRPFAAGRVSVRTGAVMSAGLLVAAFLICIALPWQFAALLAIYLILTTAYSFWLKRKLLVDVMLLAALYTHRIISGAAAVQVTLTMWLLAFSMFFFLSLAFAKRYSELIQVEDAGGEKVKGREYRVGDLRIIEGVGPASGYMSVLVFCNYLDSPLVKTLYPHPRVLWFVAPLLLYWITRVWFIARRKAMHDDPIIFAIRDRVSRLTFVLIALVVLAAWLPLSHWWRF